MAESKLSTKQDLWIAAYLGEARGNATEAARMAGYKNPEPSGKDNVRNHTIAARIAEYVGGRFATSDDVLRELTAVAMAPWNEFIEVLSRDRDGRPIKVKMDVTNKVRALELLGKHHGLFAERQQIDVNIREHRVVGVAQVELEAMFRPSPPRELTG